MKYERARAEIRSGDLLFWSYRKFGTLYDAQVQAVRVLTRSTYSHVGVARMVDGVPHVCESVNAGVQCVPLVDHLPFYWVTMGLAWNAAAEAFLQRTLKAPYSKWQAIKGQLGMLKIGADNWWQCSEFSICLIKSMGAQFASKATPQSMWTAAMQRESAIGRYVGA